MTAAAPKILDSEVTKYLTKLINAKLRKPSQPSSSTSTEETHHDTTSVFHGQSAPKIPLQKYLARISEMAKLAQDVQILAVVYLLRLSRTPDITMDNLSVHRLLLTSLLIASKFTQDTVLNNRTFARIGGIPSSELLTLEKEFLRLIGYELYVDQ